MEQMQGQILIVGSDRNLILGDDGVRYAFTSQEWRSGDMEPEAGMTVAFEVQGSDAVGIYPVPAAPVNPVAHQPPVQPPPAAPQPPVQPPPAVPAGLQPPVQPPPAVPAGLQPPVQPPVQPPPTHYGPTRGANNNIGMIVIAAGIALLALSPLLDFLAWWVTVAGDVGDLWDVWRVFGRNETTARLVIEVLVRAAGAGAIVFGIIMFGKARGGNIGVIVIVAGIALLVLTPLLDFVIWWVAEWWGDVEDLWDVWRVFGRNETTARLVIEVLVRAVGVGAIVFGIIKFGKEKGGGQ